MDPLGWASCKAQSSAYEMEPLDASMLARLGRVDVSLLSTVHYRGDETQADLAVVRGRDALVGNGRKLGTPSVGR